MTVMVRSPQSLVLAMPENSCTLGLFPEDIQHPGPPLMPQLVRAEILGYRGSFLGCA